MADDGKRFSSDGRFVYRWVDEIEEWGGGLGEGGCRAVPDNHLADFFSMVFSACFFRSFSEGPFSSFFVVSGGFEGPEGGHFGYIS